MLKKCFLVFVLLVFKWIAVFSQVDSISLNTIVEKTDKFAAEHPFEKVYLHFDKPYYAISDTIWFKAYLTIGPAHQLSVYSNIIYVDLLTPEDSLFKSLKIPATNGLAFGDIVLKDLSLKKGNYHIRAYTNWMRNFGPDYFFNKTIAIGDAANTLPAPVYDFVKSTKNVNEYSVIKGEFKETDGQPLTDKKVSWVIQNTDGKDIEGKGQLDKNGQLIIYLNGSKFNIDNAENLITNVDLGNRKVFRNKYSIKKAFAKADVQFFAEGGELIDGLRSKIAFKVLDAKGYGLDVTGSVFDNAGNDVADFATQHAGMGIFALLPQSDKTYKAVVNFPDGSKSEYEMPKVRSDGIFIAVNNNDPENLTVKVAANDAFFKQYQNRGYYIIAQNGATIYYTSYIALQSKVYNALIPTNKFPSGVLQVTLLAADGEPLSERVCFINRNDNLNLSIKPAANSNKPLGHTVLTLLAKKDTTPVTGNFSVAVIDEHKVPNNDDTDLSILSSILLTSDLNGFIENPNYYFNGTDNKRVTDLDILMLTQGYRRFSYHEILDNKLKPITYNREQGIQISGTLRTVSGVPVFSGNVNLKIPDRNISLNAVTDVDGHFLFDNVNLLDSTKVILNARNNNNADNLVITADAPSPQPITKGYEAVSNYGNIDSLMHIYLLNTKKQIDNLHMLNEVVVNSTRSEKIVHEDYAALKGLGFQPDQAIGPNILKYCTGDFEECMIGRVFGIWHVENDFYIKKDYLAGNKKPIKFFVNGSAVDVLYLKSINGADVLNIEIYTKDGVSGLMRFYDCNGIISITTKSHSFSPNTNAVDLTFLKTAGNMITLLPKGYYKSKTFYSPKYTTDQADFKRVIDLRSTIFWSPNVFTDKKGNATLEYFNALGAGIYKVVIEGIDAEGKIGRFVYRYQVN